MASKEIFDTLDHPPKHVAIIMDGNGRWARERGKPRSFGHQQGANAVERAVRAAHDLGIEYLSLFAFSTENWRRPEDEVSTLMGLLRTYLRSKLNDLHKENVRLRIAGRRDDLPKDIAELIEYAESKTAENTGLRLIICLSYSGIWDITQAARKLAQRAADPSDSLTAEDVTPEILASELATAPAPAVDLMIRTSGEQRISNFMLWQCAYAEFVFVDCHWPDFDGHVLQEACQSFSRRERRFGSVPAATSVKTSSSATVVHGLTTQEPIGDDTTGKSRIA